METSPFFIEVESNGCSHCGENKTWCVVGPDGVEMATTFGGEEGEVQAQEFADSLNHAYAAGAGRVADLEKAIEALNSVIAGASAAEKALRIKFENRGMLMDFYIIQLSRIADGEIPAYEIARAALRRDSKSILEAIKNYPLETPKQKE